MARCCVTSPLRSPGVTGTKPRTQVAESACSWVAPRPAGSSLKFTPRAPSGAPPGTLPSAAAALPSIDGDFDGEVFDPDDLVSDDGEHAAVRRAEAETPKSKRREVVCRVTAVHSVGVAVRYTYTVGTAMRGTVPL